MLWVAPSRHTDAFIGVFWLLLGLVEEDKISVEDPAFSLSATFGRIFMIAHVVCTVIVALNMLIAMMNNSFERIMVSFLFETNMVFGLFQQNHGNFLYEWILW